MRASIRGSFRSRLAPSISYLTRELGRSVVRQGILEADLEGWLDFLKSDFTRWEEWSLRDTDSQLESFRCAWGIFLPVGLEAVLEGNLGQLLCKLLDVARLWRGAHGSDDTDEIRKLKDVWRVNNADMLPEPVVKGGNGYADKYDFHVLVDAIQRIEKERLNGEPLNQGKLLELKKRFADLSAKRAQ